MPIVDPLSFYKHKPSLESNRETPEVAEIQRKPALAINTQLKSASGVMPPNIEALSPTLNSDMITLDDQPRRIHMNANNVEIFSPADPLVQKSSKSNIRSHSSMDF